MVKMSIIYVFCLNFLLIFNMRMLKLLFKVYIIIVYLLLICECKLWLKKKYCYDVLFFDVYVVVIGFWEVYVLGYYKCY